MVPKNYLNSLKLLLKLTKKDTNNLNKSNPNIPIENKGQNGTKKRIGVL